MTIHTADDDAAVAALAERFAIDAKIAEGAVTFYVPSGEQFVPRLFAELGVQIKAVSVSRPTLDDVFMEHTGSTIRDAEESGGKDRNRMVMQAMSRSQAMSATDTQPGRPAGDHAARPAVRPAAAGRARRRPAAESSAASCGRSGSSSGGS